MSCVTLCVCVILLAERAEDLELTVEGGANVRSAIPSSAAAPDDTEASASTTVAPGLQLAMGDKSSRQFITLGVETVGCHLHTAPVPYAWLCQQQAARQAAAQAAGAQFGGVAAAMKASTLAAAASLPAVANGDDIATSSARRARWMAAADGSGVGNGAGAGAGAGADTGDVGVQSEEAAAKAALAERVAAERGRSHPGGTWEIVAQVLFDEGVKTLRLRSTVAFRNTLQVPLLLQYRLPPNMYLTPGMQTGSLFVRGPAHGDPQLMEPTQAEAATLGEWLGEVRLEPGQLVYAPLHVAAVGHIRVMPLVAGGAGLDPGACRRKRAAEHRRRRHRRRARSGSADSHASGTPAAAPAPVPMPATPKRRPFRRGRRRSTVAGSLTIDPSFGVNSKTKKRHKHGRRSVSSLAEGAGEGKEGDADDDGPGRGSGGDDESGDDEPSSVSSGLVEPWASMSDYQYSSPLDLAPERATGRHGTLPDNDVRPKGSVRSDDSDSSGEVSVCGAGCGA